MAEEPCEKGPAARSRHGGATAAMQRSQPHHAWQRPPLATYGCCAAELLLQCSEFDLNSPKLVSNPDVLTEIGFAEGPTTAIVSAVHEHIATEADAEVKVATARLHHADVELDAELLAPRWWGRRRLWRRWEGVELLAPRILRQPRVPFLAAAPDP